MTQQTDKRSLTDKLFWPLLVTIVGGLIVAAVIREGELFGSSSVTNEVSAPARCSSILYTDDFSDESQGWAVEYVNPEDKSTNGYRDGGYSFRLMSEGSPMWDVLLGQEFDFGNTAISFDTTVISGKGRFGTLLDFHGNHNLLEQSQHHLVTVTTDGHPEFEHRNGLNVEALPTAIASKALVGISSLQMGEPYHMIVQNSHDETIIMLENVEIGRSRTGTYGKGRLGLYIEAAKGGIPFEVYFDNLLICKQ
jgi:hypothetical protein